MTQDNSIKNPDIRLDDSQKREKFFSKEMVHNGVSNVKNNIRILIVLFVLHFAAAPLLLIMAIISILTTGDCDMDIYAVIAVLTTGAAVASGILCATTAMPYLHKKSLVDMRLSLPMTTLQRFVSDFLSGLFMYIAPFLAADILTAILVLIGHLTCDGRTFNPYCDYTWQCTVFEEAAAPLFMGILGGIAIMLMFYTLTVLVSSCCGSLFECVMYTVFVNGLVPGTIAVLIYFITYDVKGLVADSYIASTIPYTSPVGGAIGLVLAIESYISSKEMPLNDYRFSYVKWILIFFIVTIIMAIAAYLIYRARKAEDTGTPVIFGALYHVIMTLASICIIYPFLNSGLSIIAMIILTAIIYFVFSVIRRRGFHKFYRAVISYILTMVCCVGSYYIITKTNAFGAADYVPAPSSVSKAYISYNGLYEVADSNFGGFDVYYSDVPPTAIKSLDNLTAVTEAHSICINSDDLASDDLRIIYKMKSGRTVVREYPLCDEARKTLSEMDTTEEMKTARIEKDTARIANAESYYHNRDSYYNDYTDTVELDIYYFYRTGSFKSNSCPFVNSDAKSEVNIYRLPSDFYDRLTQCIAEDIGNETEEQYFRDGKPCYLLSFPEYSAVTIRSYYTNTIEYLKECGFHLPEPSVSDIAQIAENGSISVMSTGLWEYITGKDTFDCTSGYEAGWGRVEYFSDESYYRTYSITSFAYFTNYSDVLYDAVTNACGMYKSDKPIYTINVDGAIAAVPEDMEQCGEELFITAVGQTFVDRMLNYEYSDYSYDVDSVNMYKDFLAAFLEYYGKEKINSVSRAVTGSDDQSLYGAIFAFVYADYQMLS